MCTYITELLRHKVHNVCGIVRSPRDQVRKQEVLRLLQQQQNTTDVPHTFCRFNIQAHACTLVTNVTLLTANQQNDSYFQKILRIVEEKRIGNFREQRRHVLLTTLDKVRHKNLQHARKHHHDVKPQTIIANHIRLSIRRI